MKYDALPIDNYFFQVHTQPQENDAKQRENKVNTFLKSYFFY